MNKPPHYRPNPYYFPVPPDEVHHASAAVYKAVARHFADKSETPKFPTVFVGEMSPLESEAKKIKDALRKELEDLWEEMYTESRGGIYDFIRERNRRRKK